MMPQQLAYRVTGENTMHCISCERTVTTTLKHIPGIRDVTADHETQLIRISLFSKEFDEERLIAELDAIGYHVEPVTGL